MQTQPITPREPVLIIKDLTVRLPASAERIHAVNQVSLEVLPKEILCIVGESGSGKSVTAHSVMGLLPEDQLKTEAGSISVLGEPIIGASPKRLRQLRGNRMAMIFQEPMTALNPVMPLGRQIEEVLTEHTDMSSRDRKNRVYELMESVNLPDKKNLFRSYPHEISGGQRQRVMIALALALEPALLIADEPTTALDVTTQQQILNLIKDIQKNRDTGVLFITHDFGVVAEIADRVIVMKDGTIVEHGKTENVLSHPKDDYTAMLIDAVPSLIPKSRHANPGKEIAISTKSLEKIYKTKSLFGRRRTVKAADDISFDIRRGETLGIVGESGSGKSTVARCIARLINPSAGEIRVNNTNIAEISERAYRPLRKHIQIVFQDPYRSLNPRQTVGRAIAEGPMNYGLGRAEATERTRTLLKLVGLDSDAMSRYPHQFSGGQRQRICIARALAMEPDVLVADEPVSALDVSVQAQVLELLKTLQSKLDLAILFITHDLRVAAQVSDNIAVMYHGKIVEHGPTKTIFENPKHEYTKRLFKAAPGQKWDFN
ncbi:MAG: microcin ABC transporter ATP-binding protein [Chloroflexi bacterium]|nr:microcin ABC transporter ATP-binding protein [Chloroflexota bacterium]